MPSQLSNDLANKSEPPLRRRALGMSAAQFGMVVFLVSLSVLFVASIAAYLITRYNHASWSQVEFTLPISMLAGGLPLAATSISLELALRAIRRNNQTGVRRALKRAGLYGFAFLGIQTFNWVLVMQASADPNHALALFVFYMLTGLHAMHVVGGFVPLGVVLQRAYAREYSSSRYEGLRLCSQYWHFLGVVWIALMTTMYTT
jgi:cytochrome c oxidase subunit 3